MGILASACKTRISGPVPTKPLTPASAHIISMQRMLGRVGQDIPRAELA
ncbi:hypothetical protein BN873_360076 [Candidatus Competibacter denitrificans Run_A_D11]|uniref:Uncharacterized protein n=1 Tax=Candidatus Competibacter denitrificans Run_A_D11 TaxID=1400863 RepID=W6M5G6_9GAMM|nr:hypothetical protein BN873_360076 [Candidatus Competibacter denitrificans Run_A_D11]